jgi:type II secretory pathway pseudopilin PulG
MMIQHSRISVGAGQRGFVLVAVLVVFVVSLTLFGVWARRAVGQHRRSRIEQVRLQAVRLAESGVRRALARQALDGNYAEEKWAVPTGVLDQTRAAEVRIRVEPPGDNGKLRFTATAEFPLGVVQRAQITRQIEIPSPEPEETR